MMDSPIYLDYNATTPVDPEVLDSMLPYFSKISGNASNAVNIHGKKSLDAVEEAREKIASLIYCHPSEIIFTSGATESINLFLKGIALNSKYSISSILTTKTDHSAVLETCKYLEMQNVETVYLPLTPNGLVDIGKLENCLSKETQLLSLIHANNETGTIQNTNKIGNTTKNKNTIFFSDATQAVGKIKVDPKKDFIDGMAFSAHKLYGPKGIGALFINKDTISQQLLPLHHGGGQEKGLRSGTMNVPGIVGFGKACEIAQKCIKKDQVRISNLRNLLLDGIQKTKGIQLNGEIQQLLPNTLNLSIKGVEAHMLVEALESTLSISTGSACGTVSRKPSHVLQALKYSKDRIGSSIRISIGRYTNKEEIENTIIALKDIISKLRI